MLWQSRSLFFFARIAVPGWLIRFITDHRDWVKALAVIMLYSRAGCLISQQPCSIVTDKLGSGNFKEHGKLPEVTWDERDKRDETQHYSVNSLNSGSNGSGTKPSKSLCSWLGHWKLPSSLRTENCVSKLSGKPRVPYKKLGANPSMDHFY